MAIPEADVRRRRCRARFVMIGSTPSSSRATTTTPGRPGCFTRVLGRYVRDEGALSLVDGAGEDDDPAGPAAARRRCPAMARKGRLQVGADADITVFDPATVADRATVADPSQESVGIDWVLVAGEVVQDPRRRAARRPAGPAAQAGLTARPSAGGGGPATGPQVLDDAPGHPRRRWRPPPRS